MRTGREDRGQSTVEFALILPLLLITAVILIHIGVALAVQLQLESAAREGARAAAVEPNQANAVARTAVSKSTGDRPVDVAVTVEADWVTVDATTEVTMIPFLGTAGKRTLRADAVMRREDLID